MDQVETACCVSLDCALYKAVVQPPKICKIYNVALALKSLESKSLDTISIGIVRSTSSPART